MLRKSGADDESIPNSNTFAAITSLNFGLRDAAFSVYMHTPGDRADNATDWAGGKLGSVCRAGQRDDSRDAGFGRAAERFA